MADPSWQTLDEISARARWGKLGAVARKRALAHAVTHVELEPAFVRSGARGREYSPEAVEVIIVCLRGRGLHVDGRMATIGEREAWEQLHGRAG